MAVVAGRGCATAAPARVQRARAAKSLIISASLRLRRRRLDRLAASPEVEPRRWRALHVSLKRGSLLRGASTKVLHHEEPIGAARVVAKRAEELVTELLVEAPRLEAVGIEPGAVAAALE